MLPIVISWRHWWIICAPCYHMLSSLFISSSLSLLLIPLTSLFHTLSFRCLPSLSLFLLLCLSQLYYLIPIDPIERNSIFPHDQNLCNYQHTYLFYNFVVFLSFTFSYTYLRFLYCIATLTSFSFPFKVSSLFLSLRVSLLPLIILQFIHISFSIPIYYFFFILL